ncbi:MAG: hypothetical protein GY749_47880 [Desulfobacteraceae bacterium]|nr:hypothetical protein [Desulfobacteraceae bacterium]
MNDLVIYEEQHLESWEQKLEKFGMQFGLKPDECEKSINTLIGSMIKSTGTGHPAQINKEFLIESLTGSRLSQPLQPSSVVKLSKEDVNDFMKSHPSDPIQRHILKDLLKTTMEHALVVVHGDGGCGKSVLLGQWAQSKIESGDTGVFTKIEHGQGVLTTNLIPDIIRNWGCLPESLFSPPNNEDALKRLRTANQNLDNIQILHLGIDAFDEVTDREDREVKNNIRKIMKWFYEKDIKLKNAGEAPAVVLVVTCRNQGKIRELLSSDDYVKFETLFGKVSVDDFMPEELFESASVHVPDLASKIIKELSPSSDPGYFNDELFDDMPSYTPTHNDTLTRTLLHPAMWGCFLKQPREVKTAILDGDTDKAKPMLELYVERFCDKSRRRGILSEKDELTEVIRHIACQSKATGDTQYSVKEWKLWACDSEILLSLYEAEKIRKEALSHGLIRRIDTRKWCWRNIYLRDYLVNLPE